jgi:uncharacterized LabA/DUF88 family protein
MYNQLFQPKEELLNAAIYIDYENIYELLKIYQADPLEINFFPVILAKLKHTYQLNVMECIAYCNFEKKPLQARHQSLLQNLGIQTRHSANNGKNSSDLMLTVDSLTTLYKNPNIKVFVIISSDRDIIPLLKAVKFENKHTHVISTRYGFCPVVSCYADRHEYIEDIFNLTPDMRAAETEAELNFDIENNRSNIEQAREISILFYNSNVKGSV